jgi:hypothetical protein
MPVREREAGAAPAGGGGLARFRYEYGAQPLHLIAVLFSLALIGYALLRITEIPGSTRILLWLLAAALLHDFVALPAYSALLLLSRGAAGRAFSSRAMAVHALNHVRVPAGLSLLLLVAYLPLILRIAPDEYLATTGRTVDPYLGRWLLITAALFLISGVAYAVRLRRGVPEPAGQLERIGEGERLPGPGLGWRVAGRLSIGAAALAILWVAAAVVVGLVTTGFGG